MGNSSSQELITDMSILRFKMQIEDLVMKDVSLEEVVSSLQWICLQGDPTLLDHLADTIIYQAISNPNQSPRYLSLAKLTELSVTKDTKEEFIFKDIFMQKSINIFEEMETDTVIKSRENHKKAQFLGNLFNAGIVSTVLMNYWLSKIHDTHPEEQKIVLETIADKVELEFQRPIHERHFNSLMQLLQERGIIRPKKTTQTDKTNTSINNLPKSREVLQESSDSDDFEYGSDSLNYTNNRETSFTAAARMQSKNHPSVQLMPPAPQKTRYYEENVQKDFQAYLKNPVENKYKVQVFKTCTDAVRKNCAKLILDFVISNPQNINEYANITRDIVTSGSLSSSVHKTLLMHMIDFLTEMQQWHFSKGTKKNWDEFTNIGKFLGQIQKRDLLKPALLCKWLDGVFDMIAADTNAVKSYVSVLSIVMIKLEADDKVTYKKHKQNLSSLCSKGKIPHQYMQWTSSIFTKSQGNLSKASSMSSVVSETSSTSKKSELPIQPTATTQICTNFQKFLNNLEAGRNEKIDLNVLRSCSEAAVRGCALILLEHAAMYPKNAKLYAAATQNTIVSQISQRLQFTENLAHYFDVELTKWYKLDAPEKSNWSRIKNVAVFLGELYNFKVFDIKVLSNWVEKICLKEDFNANGAAMILFNIIRDKLMHRSAEIYERFVIFPKISESDTKFVASFRKLMKEAGKIKMDEKKPTKAQILQQIYSPPLVQYSPSIYPPPMPQLQTDPRAHLAPFLMKSATPMRAPFMQVPIAPNQSVYTFIQPAPAPPRNAFDELQRLVNVKLNFGNHALIIHEIMSLKIPETEENFRKITNTLVSRAKQRPDLIPCVCEILVKFPQKLKNDSDFRNQTRLSLNQQFDFLCSRSKVDLTEVQQIVILVKEAHLRSAIGINVLSRVVENVATKALNDVKVSLKVLLIMLKGLGEETVRKASVTKWVDTDATLRFHLTISSGKLSEDLRKDCEFVISWICYPLGLKVPKLTVIPLAEIKPSIPQNISACLKSSTSSSSENFIQNSQPSPKNLDFFIKLESNVDELQEFIASLDVMTSLKMENFSKKFYNIATHSSQKIADTVQLARIFNDSLNSQNPAESFRKIFTKTLLTKFSELPDDDAVNYAQAKVLIEFIAELYKIGWIEGEFVMSLMDGLAENNFEMYQLDLFQGLLQKASMTMVVNGDCGRFENYLRVLERKRKISQTLKSFLMCNEVIEMLETALMLSKGADRFNEKQVREVLTDVDKDTAVKIKKLPMKTVKDFKIFTEVFIEKAAADPDDVIDYAKLAVKIKNYKVADLKFKELLIEKSQEKLLEFLGSGKLTQLLSTMGLLRFVGELYVNDIMKFDLVNLCFELLDDDGSDGAADCFTVLLKTVGAKIEKENIEQLSEIFENFKKKSLSKSGYRAAVIKEMNELRENNWNQNDKYEEIFFEGTTEDIVAKLSTLDIENAADSLPELFKTPEEIEKLIQAIWKLTLTMDVPKVYAKLCVEYANNHEDFSQLLADFLQRRNAAFHSIRTNQFTEAIRNRLVNVLTFVSDLFVQSLVSDEDYSSWIQIKLIRQLPQTFIPLLISEIEQKIGKSENIRLKACLMILDGMEHERAIDNMQELSQNIKEITKIVHNLEKNQIETNSEKIQIEIV